MENYFETDHGISSKDDMSWYESEPEFDALSDTNSETDGNDTKSKDENVSVSQEIREKDGYLWKMEPKTAKRTPKRNIVTGAPGPKGKEREAYTPLESFELFFNDFMLLEIVTWTNQKIKNVRKAYTIKSRFTYDTNETEVRVLIEILLFLSVTKSCKESTVSTWATDGTGKSICIAAMTQKRFLFLRSQTGICGLVV